MIFITLFIVFIIKCTARKGNDRLRFRLLALGTAYLALSSVRSYPLFIICGIIPLSYLLKEYKIKDYNMKADKRTLLIRKVLVGMIVAVSLFTIYKSNMNQGKEFEELVKSSDYLERFNKSEVKLYTSYNDGGYLEFRGFKVYIDPRAEVFLETNNKKYNIMKEYTDMKSGRIYYKEVLNKYNFTHLLISKNDILNTYLPYDDSYKVIYSSDEYKIYENTKLNK
ncbi:MAG: hypothetical protein ABRQ25_06670 [Clostridiaceae bacterium]